MRTGCCLVLAVVVALLCSCEEEGSCEDHYVACIDSRLGSVRDGPNRTRCQNCYDRCVVEGQWPAVTYAGGDCRWWNYRWVVAEEDAPPDAVIGLDAATAD